MKQQTGKRYWVTATMEIFADDEKEASRILMDEAAYFARHAEIEEVSF